METISNRRLAKNTVILYFRMLFTMAVALYTSRVVLGVLGASDYGLYNVVGGIVSMLAFLNSSMGAGTSRFIAFELGRNNQDRLSTIFNVALVSHIIIALIVFVVSETIGLWYINTHLVYPPERVFAVNVVFQISILTTMLQFTQLPYTADIIAHEEMGVYAYVTIAEVSLKLLMVLLLKYVQTPDSLITYALMLFAVQFIILTSYRVFCRKHYSESKWKFVRDISEYKTILKFSGWDTFGGLTIVTQNQGINILLNAYFGPIVNAASAIAYQVQGAFSQFTNNFMTAVNPEMIKSFAREEFKPMIKLVNDSALYSFFLLLVFVFPVLFKLQYILDLWLVEYPDNTIVFTEIVLVLMMIRALARPVIMAIHATGDIKSLNLYAGILGLLPLPVSWIALHFGAPAVSAFLVIFLWGIFANIAEIIILKTKMKDYFSIKKHMSFVYIRSFTITLILFFPIYGLSLLFGDSFVQFCVYYAMALLLGVVCVFFLGFSSDMRRKITTLIKNKYALYRAK